MILTVDERYRRFFTLHPSHRECTALRIEGCRLLDRLVRERKPERVLDLGSGITSHILRGLKLEFPEMYIVTTDTSIEYLQITVDELQREGLDATCCMSHMAFEHFMRSYPEITKFDLISVDISNLDFRMEHAALFASWLAPNGIMVLDDFGMRDYAERMTVALNACGLTVSSDPTTRDEYDTYMATAEHTA